MLIVNNLTGFGGRRAAGGVTGADIELLTPYVFYSVEDLNDVWKVARTENVATDGDTIAAIDDRSANEYHIEEATDKPAFENTSGIDSVSMDGTNNVLEVVASMTARPSDCSVFLTVNTTDVNGCFFGAGGGGGYNGIYYFWEDGSTSWAQGSAVGDPDLWVDEAEIRAGTTVRRDDVHTAIADGDWHVVELRTVDFTDTTPLDNLQPFYYITSTWRGACLWSDFIIIPTANFTSTDRDDTIIPYLKSRVGL